MFHKNIKYYTVIIFLAFFDVLYAQIKLPSIISNNMVLQQKSSIPIWGWADSGEKVTVKAGWLMFAKHTTADDDGRWEIVIKTPTAGGPYTLSIKSNNSDDAVVLNNILMGEVWLCAGQSNMWWPLEKTENAKNAIQTAGNSQIRFFNVPPVASSEPLTDCNGCWQICTLATASHFSAVAYYFGKNINQKLNFPVGLISSSWGGTPAEAWARKQVLINDDKLNAYIERDTGWDAEKSKYEQEYKEKLNQWEENKQIKKNATRPAIPLQLRPQFRCSSLYNGMINPIIPFGIKGVIWYQGEANSGAGYLYRRLFPAMIQSWRDEWGQGDFSFYFVQLANLYRNISGNKPAKLPDIGQPSASNWAELREAQFMTLSLPKTGMAVTMDIGEAYNIHPKNKCDVGKRLALWAFAKDYGFENIVYSGPLYKRMQVEGDKIRLYFCHTGSGLFAKGKVLKGFSIAADDQKFVWADAVIEGNTVVVCSDEIDNPVAVRYGWANWILCNLFNKEGLPASPFRTDNWPGITINKIMW